MQQHDFIWVAKNHNMPNVVQDSIGNTKVVIRDNIELTHNYKTKMMTLIFLEDGSHYSLPDKRYLVDIFEMANNNEHLTYILKDYATKNLYEV